MANNEQLEILRKGVGPWNHWRVDHPDLKPALQKADLHEADLEGINLKWADLSAANLKTANLSRASLDGVILQGANLVRAQLELACLEGANLVASNLSEACLRGATLTGANLSHAGLQNANLQGAFLVGADLSDAILSNAKLTGTSLGQANLSSSKLDGTDFTESILQYTSFGGVDIRSSKGLESVRHTGPSMIGVDTIYLSNGRIPEKFLRGAGVPDQFITYMKSLVGNPIEFYSCFISDSSKDEEFADRLYSDLQNKNVRYWFAPHDVQGGQKLHEQIDQAIRVHEKLLLILSPHSIASEWVRTEIAKARKRELHEKKRILFPVRLVSLEVLREWECFDADMGKDSAREIREFFIPDFSDWKDHSKYKEAFVRLLRDLKAGADCG